MEQMRIDKLVSEIFGLSRKQARDEIAAGNVTVNGEIRKKSSEHCLPTDKVCLSGSEGKYQQYVYIMMNKPKGVISATKDAKAKTAVDLLPPDLFRKDLFVAGRLDKNTTGFLLFTNNGDFAHNILSPKKHIPKTYVALLASDPTEQDVQKFEEGILLGEFRCKPAKLEVLGNCKARITICEGKFHQIKRMFFAVQNEVIELHREKMGGLKLDAALAPGQARALSEQELQLMINGENQ